MLVDSHSAPAPPEVWALLEHVLARGARYNTLTREAFLR